VDGWGSTQTMTRRIVTLVLGVALTSGVVIGAAGGQVGVRTLLASLGVQVPAFAERLAGPLVEPSPPPLVVVPVSFTGAQLDGSGRGTVTVEVPEGWRELVKAELWRDFHDPTEELNLRIRADLSERTPEEAAAAHRRKNDNLPNYLVISEGWTPLAPELPSVYELRYSYTDKGRTRYVIEAFFGTDRVLMVGGYYWEGQEDRILEPIVEAVRSCTYADVR
jgi:hypothetical protein